MVTFHAGVARKKSGKRAIGYEGSRAICDESRPTSVVLPGKSHLSAIVAESIPPLYIETLEQFLNANDPK